MSIILDALKKAETERHLGQLPGMHTPRASTSEMQSASPRAPLRAVWYGVAGAVVVVAIATTLWITSTHEHSAAIVVMPVSQPSQPELAQSATTGQLNQPARLVPSSVPLALTTPALPPSTLSSTREIPVPPPLPPAPAKPLLTVAAKSAPPVAVSRDTQSTQISVPAASEKIIMMADLPPALQRELPPLAIGGSMYSDNAAQRMLLVDKRLLHEGDEVAPNLVLEKLRPKEAILRIRGTRFRIAF